MSAGNDEKNELLQNQIIYLREECNSKNQLINLILENVFKSDIPKVTCYKNSNALLTPNDDYQFLKRFNKNLYQKSYCNSYTHDNRFHTLSVNEDSQNSNEDLHVTESSRETVHSDNNQNQNHPTEKTNRNRAVNRNQRQKKLPVKVMLGDSIVKEVKGWELSDENNKVFTKQFSRAATDDMKSYIQSTISIDPECIVFHCGTNDLRQKTSAVEIGQKILKLAVSCKSGSSNILISGIFPRRDKLNAKAAQVNSFLKNECGKRNICFIYNSDIKPRYHCNQRGIHK